MNVWCDTYPICLLACLQPFFRAVLHDPAIYPDPDSFKPERFINPDGSVLDDPVLAVGFGSGKRICPGRHLVDSTLFIVVASLLAVFDIRGNGTDKGPDAYPFTGSCLRCGHRVAFVAREKLGELTADLIIFSVPCPFTCSITPRDRRAEELITAIAQA
jgi:cytochrome P450